RWHDAAACLGDVEFVEPGCGADQQRCEQSRSGPGHRPRNGQDRVQGRVGAGLGNVDRAKKMSQLGPGKRAAMKIGFSGRMDSLGQAALCSSVTVYPK